MSRADLDLGDTHIILAECTAQSLSRAQAAYVLATAYWETDRTMEPVREAYRKSEEWRTKNLRYHPWYGRGYVQLTWERNYRHAGRQLGLDLTTDPDKVMEPEIAVRILVMGMIEGWFSGKKLDDYINDQHTDFRRARQIVNILDKADAIATIARDYDRELAGIGYGGEEPRADTAQDLEQGNTSPKALVMILQQDLKSLGYFSGKVDGIYGRLTKRAVLAFQADNDLETDGIVGPATREAMDKAKPATSVPRDITAADLSKRGSKTIKATDAQVGAVAVGGLGVTIEAARGALAAVQDGQGTLEWLATFVRENWPLALVLGALAVAWVLAGRIRAERVRKAVDGTDLSL